MKVWLIYASVFGFGLLTIITLISAGPSPELSIHGQWKELSWEYEKTNKTARNDSERFKHISEEVKKSIGQNLIIHSAETWEFLPNGKLRLIGNDMDKTVSWRIKGRGHILELRYENHTTEHYNLTELNQDRMILNFETDIQARGIAKLTFEKIK